MKKILIALLALAIVQSCSTPSEFQVSRVGNEPEEYEERMIYVLPQTVFKVTVEFERVTSIPGPYRIYSEKYLGIDDYITETSVAYRITNVNLESFTEPDPDQYFSINILNGDVGAAEYLNLTSQGFILDPGRLFGYSSESYLNERVDQARFFDEIPVKTNLIEKADTLFKTIITDSSFVKIPVVRRQVEAKTLEQKARETAALIVKIRQKKLKMLSGGKELKPETDAFIFAMQELAEMERQNIELFTGKTLHTGFKKVFLVTPEANTAEQTISLARFSPQMGLTSTENTMGEDLTLNVRSLEKTRDISNSLNTLNRGFQMNNLYYRIPDLAVVQIKVATDLLFESRHSIYQAGAMVNIPLRE